MKKTFWALIILTVWLGSASARAGLIIDNGQLMGATGVSVGGVLYDLTFVDGTCTGLFGGCNEASDFDFQTQNQASMAANAISALFADVAAFGFDFEPSLTNGCDSSLLCNILIPYAVAVPGFMYVSQNFVNSPWLLPNANLPGGGLAFINTADLEASTYARFTVAVADSQQVSAPGTAVLLGLGLALFGWSRKGRKADMAA